MRLAKSCFDVGLMIDRCQFRLEDWTEIGLQLDHVIEIEGLLQHRFNVDQAVLKVNVAIEPLADGPPSGLARFAIHGKRFSLQDGSPVYCPEALAPAPARSVGGQGLDIEIATPSPKNAIRFYSDVFGLEQVDGATVRCGRATIGFRTAARPALAIPLRGRGIRYLTFQVFDADAVCKDVEARGGAIGRSPIDYGNVARYGFVIDPDGNWIEISARASVIAAYQN